MRSSGLLSGLLPSVAIVALAGCAAPNALPRQGEADRQIQPPDLATNEVSGSLFADGAERGKSSYPRAIPDLRVLSEQEHSMWATVVEPLRTRQSTGLVAATEMFRFMAVKQGLCRWQRLAETGGADALPHWESLIHFWPVDPVRLQVWQLVPDTTELRPETMCIQLLASGQFHLETLAQDPRIAGQRIQRDIVCPTVTDGYGGHLNQLVPDSPILLEQSPLHQERILADYSRLSTVAEDARRGELLEQTVLLLRQATWGRQELPRNLAQALETVSWKLHQSELHTADRQDSDLRISFDGVQSFRLQLRYLSGLEVDQVCVFEEISLSRGVKSTVYPTLEWEAALAAQNLRRTWLFFGGIRLTPSSAIRQSGSPATESALAPEALDNLPAPVRHP